MKPIIPEPRMVLFEGGKTSVNSLCFDFSECDAKKFSHNLEEVVSRKMSSLTSLSLVFGEVPDFHRGLKVIGKNYVPEEYTRRIPDTQQKHFAKEGYVLEIDSREVRIYSSGKEGLLHGISTLKQLLWFDEKQGSFVLPLVTILDYPILSVRSISTTFTWYAGYSRIGFDMQLWGKEEWESFVVLCSDFKINQINMCMYGYWPFSFPEYPETELRNFPMRVWNAESRNWVQISYSHPNISNPFLEDLICFAHSLGISMHAYIGLNSYSGGFAAVHRDKRMVVPPGSRFINDFDSLCPSLPENLEYLKAAVRKIASLGFDGIIFEESEENFWFCHCDACKKNFVDTTSSAAEAKHKASYWLLSVLVPEIKKVNPDCQIGLRAWREPPLVKSEEYLEDCKRNIPEEVVLYWAPGLYVPESEFEKWVRVFGPERICARDSESNAWSATQGRLFRMFRRNILRGDTEANDQFIEKDIEQHIGSLRHSVRGINGYLFEWYGYFLHLFAHSQYGWGSSQPADVFYRYALSAVFGDDIGSDVLYILEHFFTIHESQLHLFRLDFPFLKNKVDAEDVPLIQQALKEADAIEHKLQRVMEYVRNKNGLDHYLPHFQKLLNCLDRNREIYKLCLASIQYDNADSSEEKRRWLREMYEYNERNFELIKAMYFDINPVSAAGVKICMYPYHELKRLIVNELFPERYDPEPIYLGAEALGWLWIDKKY